MISIKQTNATASTHPFKKKPPIYLLMSVDLFKQRRRPESEERKKEQVGIKWIQDFFGWVLKVIFKVKPSHSRAL